MASALGFGVAYYFDPENGGLRRKRLHEMVERTRRNFDSVSAAEAEEEPPVFHPVHGLRAEGRARRRTARVETVR